MPFMSVLAKDGQAAIWMTATFSAQEKTCRLFAAFFSQALNMRVFSRTPRPVSLPALIGNWRFSKFDSLVLMVILAAGSPESRLSDIEGTSSPSARLWNRKNCHRKSSTRPSRASRASCPSPPQGIDALSRRRLCRHFGHFRTFPDNDLKQPKNVRKRPQMSAIAYRPPITQETYNGAPLTMLVS